MQLAVISACSPRRGTRTRYTVMSGLMIILMVCSRLMIILIQHVVGGGVYVYVRQQV